MLFIIILSTFGFAFSLNANASLTTSLMTSLLNQDTSAWMRAAEDVLKDTANLNDIGWDLGDVNGDKKITRSDENDLNFNGVQDANEEDFTGQMVVEPWTHIYTLINPVDPSDDTAFKELEELLCNNLFWSLSIVPDVDKNGNYTGGASFDISRSDPWQNKYTALYIPSTTHDLSGVFVLISGGPNKTIEASVSIQNNEVVISHQSDDTICTIARTYDMRIVSNTIISEIPEIEDFKVPKTEDEFYEYIVEYCMPTILERGNSPYNEVGIALCEIFGEDENVKYITAEHITIVSDMLSRGGIKDPNEFLNERFYKIQMDINGEILDVYLNVKPDKEQIKDLEPASNSTTVIFVVGLSILAIGAGAVYVFSRKLKRNDDINI